MTKSLYKVFFGEPTHFSKWTDISLLLLRLYAGITMASVGLDKIPLPSWMIDQVISMGFPLPTFFAWLACFSEFAFGILIALGLLTRISAFFLAFTMAVASFGFQGVTPLIDMHIAHHYVWTFVLYLAIGPGSWSIDHLISSKIKEGKKSFALIGWFGFFAILALSLYIEKTGEPNPGDTEDTTEITSVNIAGSFNDWDPSIIVMSTTDGESYQHKISFEKEGLVQFKFTANRTWDINMGETDQSNVGFPTKGIAELDNGGNTQNIKVYIPEAGEYNFILNIQSYEYEVLKSEN